MTGLIFQFGESLLISVLIFLLTARISGNCECFRMKNKYGVKVDDTWGSLPESLQSVWTTDKCNEIVKKYDSFAACVNPGLSELSHCRRCLRMKEAFNIIPGQSFGSLDDIDLQALWAKLRCDEYSDEFKLASNCEPMAKFEESVCTVGIWESVNNSGTMMEPVKLAPNRFNTNPTAEWALLCPDCPAEYLEYLTKYDCTQKISAKREQSIKSRQWVSADSRCKEFWPYDFLSTFSGKTILFIGDSILGQLFRELVTILYASTKVSVTYVRPYAERWFKHFIVKFHGARLRLIFYEMYMYDGINAFYHTTEPHRLDADDTIVFNFGIHYNEIDQFREHMQKVSRDIRILDTRKHPFPRKIMFMQSVPNHFNSRNGYWLSDNTSQHCNPYKNMTEAIALDWRNLIAEEEFANHSRIGFIRIAEALYSQWDTHVELDSNKTSIDCTHFCANPGLFNYVFRMLYNALLQDVWPELRSKRHEWAGGVQRP